MVQDFKKLELSMSHLPVVSQMVPNFSMAPTTLSFPLR